MADLGPQNVKCAELVQACAAFNLWQSLSLIRQCSITLVREEIGGHVGTADTLATQSALAMLAKAFLLGAHPETPRQLDEDTLAALLRLQWRLREPLRYELAPHAGVKPPQEKLELHLSRMFYLNGPWQKERRHVFPRALLLFKLIEERNPTLTAGRLGRFLRGELGMDVHEWMLLGFATWIVGQRNGGFISLEAIAAALEALPPVRARIDDGKVQRFLDRIATTRTGFAEAAKGWEAVERAVPGLAKYTFNPLFKYPLVDLGGPVRVRGSVHTHIEPLEWLTLEAVAHGNYFLLADAHDGGLGDAFGRIFQEYVGELLRECLGGRSVVYPEEEYTVAGRSYRSADWTVVEGAEATLIECKAANLRMRGKVGVDYAHYAAEMREIGKAVEQSARFARHVIRDRRRWPHLTHVQRFHHLVVVYDRQYLANSAMRHAVQSQQPTSGDPWHVISVDEFENFFDVLRRKSLSELLAAKAANDFDYQMDFHEYVGQRLGWDQGYKNPVLNGIWSEYFDVQRLSGRVPGPRPDGGHAAAETRDVTV